MESLSYLHSYLVNYPIPLERTKQHLWTFGDSFTQGNGCLVNEPYTKYKKLYEDKIWPEIISSKLNMHLINLGMGMFSNDKILDTILSCYNLICKGDLVIISKTFFGRFDIPSKNQQYFMTLSAGMTNQYMSHHHFVTYTEDELNTIQNIAILADSSLVVDRWNFRYNFLEQLITSKGAIALVWNVEDFYENYETIQDATNNEVGDRHWSYKGHRDFANYIINKLNNE